MSEISLCKYKLSWNCLFIKLGWFLWSTPQGISTYITKFFSEQFCKYILLSRTSHKYTHPSMRKLKWEKLHFTTLNYSPNYNLQYKILECMVSTLNYKSRYSLHSAINFFCYLRQHHMQKLNCTFSHFTTLKYTFTYTFHPKPWFLIHDNRKINGDLQSLKQVIV